jgi:hypothetical protein
MLYHRVERSRCGTLASILNSFFGVERYSTKKPVDADGRLLPPSR